MPPSPRPRVGRTALRTLAGCAIAATAIGLSGCDYPAGPGSGMVPVYGGCGDSATLLRECTTGVILKGVVLTNSEDKAIDVESLDVTTRNRAGQSISLSERVLQIPGAEAEWVAYLTWNGTNVNPSAPITIHARSKEYGTGLFTDRWDYYMDAATREPAPSAPPAANLFAHDSPGATAPAPVKPTVLDARLSTGTGITYSWDTDGDGTFGDDPQGGWAGVPAPVEGTAYVPLARLQAATTTPVQPSVRITDSSGRTATASGTLPAWDKGAGELAVSAYGGDIKLGPGIGTLTHGTHDATQDVGYACIDVGNDGVYDSPLLPYMEITPLTPIGFGAYLAPAWTGPKAVRVVFWALDPMHGPTGSCDSPWPAAYVLSTHVELVNGSTKAAMERDRHVATAKPRRYAGTARVRLTGGALLSPGTQSGNSAKGVLNRGRYSLRTPARAGRLARPAGLALFAAGDFASTSDASIGLTAAGTPSIVGTTTMVIRGTQKALACLRVEQTNSSTRWTMLGGTKAARTLKMTLTGGPTLNELITDAVPPSTPVKGTGKNATRALSPVASSYAITASTGAGKGLTAACRALVKRLP